MDFDIKTLIIGLLLGIISGVGFANIFGIDWWNEISSLGSLLGGVAGLGALIVAYVAYQKWQRGIDYSLFLQECKKLTEKVNDIFDLLEDYILFRELETMGVDLRELSSEDLRKNTRLTKDLSKQFASYDVLLTSIALTLPKSSELETELKLLISLQVTANKIKDKSTNLEYSEYDKLQEALQLKEVISFITCELMTKGKRLFSEKH